MAEVVLFHHVLGLTDGVREFAERLAGGTHRVHTPDLYAGAVASSLEDGFAIKNDIGDDTVRERTEDALGELPPELVYAGISLGVMTAQRLAQTRPGARGALLYEACIPITGEWAFGPWPDSLPVQIHGMDDDEFFAHEGDADAARELVESVGSTIGELYTYPGSHHLFVDSSLPSHDADATALVVERSRAFLDRIG
ncbi:dienelactone hydrolase family protein [Ilumatobacter nonamiensis]|uniref:dienelactone hydrolase family protein n=1 Tax=Ilumatobacter nonamiensis TaxID=467093 RepID=UPI00034D2AED|nr:dienelactone hydrolase family protein [Ilumatobacter nonamiensis]